MTYNAFITRIKDVRKHPNADKLLIGNCFGQQVVVGLDTKDNELIIYFPTDGRLSMEFMEANNLIAKKDPVTGERIGGYFDERGKVRTQKFRGEKSDGYVCALSYLAYTGVDISTLQEGSPVSKINGHDICEKYVTEQTKEARTKVAKPREKTKYPCFHEHVDTEQLAYNIETLKAGTVLILTEKVHGCFISTTKVKLWDKSRAIKISDIKIGDIVIGMKDGNIVPSTVLKVFRGDKSLIWNEVTIKRSGYIGEPLNVIRCTPNHKFWVNDIKDYVKARELCDGQRISILKKSLILTQEQKEILLGIYLGDGYLLNNHIEFWHKLSHEAYTDYIVQTLGNIIYKSNRTKKSGYGTLMRGASTLYVEDIKRFFNEILSDGKDGNKLTSNIERYFTIRSLAYLYMDDGSLAHSDLQEDRAAIAVCDYNDHDANVIKNCIEKLGFKCVLHKSDGYNRIRINKDSADIMFNAISKYIPKILKYKLPVKYRDSDTLQEKFESGVGYVFIDSVVVSNNTIVSKRGFTEFDLQTSTGNYTVGNSLVHNTSQRTGNTIELKQTKLGHFINGLFKREIIHPVKDYGYVCGTRKVVLRDMDHPTGYYGANEIFRKKMHDKFVDKLHKGETVYYEVIGWANKDVLIMPSVDNKKLNDKEFVKKYGTKTVFHYGCNQDDCDVYVYRITMTNEDGHEVDYDWNTVKQRCDEMAVKHVPEITKFVYDGNKDNLFALVEQMVIGDSLLTPAHLREGVVVRVDGSRWYALKHKSFAFKVLEGIIKDTAVVDMEEAQDV